MNPFPIVSELKWAAVACLVAVIMFFRGEAHHWQDLYQRQEAAIEAAKVEAADKAKAQAAEAAQMRADLAQAQSHSQVVTKESVREIPATAHCADLSRWLRDNPDAHLPAIPAGTGGSDQAGAAAAPAADPAAGPSARDIAETIGVAQELKAEVDTWRAWYRANSR